MHIRPKHLLTGLFALAVLLTNARAQYATTTDLGGYVNDSQGKAVAGATVTASHDPSGTVKTTYTRADGRFDFRGLIVGGPYTISATADGYQGGSKTNVFTQLGTELDVNVVIKSTSGEVVKLEKYVVSANLTDLDAGATGASTALDAHAILNQPTTSRSFGDMARTNPYVAYKSGSFLTALGMNNRFNNYTIDGARINDQFGLNQSGLFGFGNPLSIDAIEQMNINLAPYDVASSGFTGADINVVTKRGTNDFHGSLYWIYTDGKRQGSDVFGTTLGTRSPFWQRTSGLTFGGPIIKNKLFFFLNYERFTQDSAATNPSFTPDAATVAAVLARVAQLTSQSMGTFGGASTVRQTTTTRLAKLDWNITDAHRASFRYSDVKGVNPNFGNLNASSYSVSQAASPTIATPDGITDLSSNYYVEQREERAISAQLISDWTPDLKTQVNFAKSEDSDPSIPAVVFPSIRIFGFPGVSQTGAKITDGSLNFGTNESRQGNDVETNTKSYSFRADYFLSQFTFSAGFDHEQTNFSDLFRQGSYGVFDYTTPTDFINDNVRGFSRADILAGTPAADISKFGQTGFYGQIKWDVSPRLYFTAGLRDDLLSSPIKPLLNVPFMNAFGGLRNDGTIDGTSRLAPRFSFNYAVEEDRKTQIRGGTGAFLGRSPWVWISNSFGNSGVGRFSLIQTPATGAPTLASYLQTQFNPNAPIGTASSDPGGVRAINLMDNKLKIPAVWRSNIAVDQKIDPLKAVLTVEYIDTKNLAAMFTDDINLRPTTIGADGRQRFAGSGATAPLVPGFSDVYRIRSFAKGGSQYASITLARPLDDHWGWMASYIHGHATEMGNFGSFTASSDFAFNDVFNQNKPEVARSDFEIQHRVLASVTGEYEYFHGLKTTFNLFYEGHTGQPYSYVYSGDLNGDGKTANDLFFFPTGPTDARFDFSGMTAAQQAGYFNFINQHGLSKYAGTYIPRNSFFSPWQNRLDLSVDQEIPAWSDKVKAEFFMDFLNFGTWLDKKIFNYISAIGGSGDTTGLVRSLGNATYDANGQIKPTATFDANNNVVLPSGSQIFPSNSASRWKIQFGARLKF